MASWRRPPGRPHNVWLNMVQEDANALLLSTLWRSEIAIGVTERRNGSLGKDVRLVSKMEDKPSFSRHLPATGCLEPELLSV